MSHYIYIIAIYIIYYLFRVFVKINTHARTQTESGTSIRITFTRYNYKKIKINAVRFAIAAPYIFCNGRIRPAIEVGMKGYPFLHLFSFKNYSSLLDLNYKLC